MATIINASTSAGLIQTADTSGILNLQSNGTTVASVSSTGVAVTGTVTASNLQGPAFSAYLAAAGGTSLTIATWTKVTFDTEEFDTNNCFFSNRFTPTVAGYYQINAKCLTAGTGTNLDKAAIYKNGVAYKDYSIYATSAIFPNAYLPISALVYFNGTTDYIELYVYTSVSGRGFYGGSTGVDTWFNGCLVRSA